MRKHCLEKAEKLADLRRADKERRKQAQGVIVRAVDEQAALHGFGDEGAAFDGKLDAEHEAFAAHFPDEVEFRGQPGKTFTEFGAARANVREEFLLFENVRSEEHT